MVTLRRLVVLRWYLIVGEALAIGLAPRLLDVPLPLLPMLGVVVLQSVANMALQRRLARVALPTDGDLFSQLVIDISALSVLMYLSGGAANPLISLLLPPVAVGALALPPRLVVAIAMLSVAAYSVLNRVYLPLPIADVSHGARLHLAGMWFSFVVSVGMLAWFIVRMAASIRQRDIELAAVREKALRDEHIVALGALAAGAAHELSTPLATMEIVAGDLEHHAALDATAVADVKLIRRQIAACKSIISQLAAQAGAERLSSAQGLPAERWLNDVYSRWREMRPQATSDLLLKGHGSIPTIITDPTLEQGMLNLLNNAANKGTNVCLSVDWTDEWLTIEVRDDGPGFPAAVLEFGGTRPLPAQGEGSGIGLFLANAAVSRLGGQLQLSNQNGAVVRVRLPVVANGAEI